MRRMGQVSPVAVEILDHIHGAVVEVAPEFGADDVGLHRGVGRSGLPHQLEARTALLLADARLESYAVDVEDHDLLLSVVVGGAVAPVTNGSQRRLTSSTRLPSGSARYASRHAGMPGYGIGGRRTAAASDTSRSTPASRSSTAKQT